MTTSTTTFNAPLILPIIGSDNTSVNVLGTSSTLISKFDSDVREPLSKGSIRFYFSDAYVPTLPTTVNLRLRTENSGASGKVSTIPGVGARANGSGSLCPALVPNVPTGNLSNDIAIGTFNAVLTLGGACVEAAGSPPYPLYCWVGIYNLTTENRRCQHIIEFEIPTPSGSGSIGNNQTLARILGTEDNTTDGIYYPKRFLTPNNVVATPSLTVNSGLVKLDPGYFYGAEVMIPANSGGNAVLQVSSISTTSGTSGTLFNYSTGISYSKALTGFEIVGLQLVLI